MFDVQIRRQKCLLPYFYPSQNYINHRFAIKLSNYKFSMKKKERNFLQLATIPHFSFIPSNLRFKISNISNGQLLLKKKKAIFHRGEKSRYKFPNVHGHLVNRRSPNAFQRLDNYIVIARSQPPRQQNCSLHPPFTRTLSPPRARDQVPSIIIHADSAIRIYTRPNRVSITLVRPKGCTRPAQTRP